MYKNGANIKAFTLAEVLITLAIIGVVAALTIPSVISNYKDKQYNTARLKALKTFGEAGKMASINDEMNSQTNATNFVNNVLSKYLKINKVCTIANSEDCGFPSQIQPLNPTATKKANTDLLQWNQIGSYNDTLGKVSSPKSSRVMSAVISTNDGFTAIVHYNPKCGRTNQEIRTSNSCVSSECGHNNLDAACMNVIYDMNGLKGPNHVGEDIGIVTVFWSGIKSVAVAPGFVPYSVNSNAVYLPFADASNACAKKGTSKIPYTMPSIDEISSLYLNQQITSLPADYYWSGSSVTNWPNYGWLVYGDGIRSPRSQSDTVRVWCVRR